MQGLHFVKTFYQCGDAARRSEESLEAKLRGETLGPSFGGCTWVSPRLRPWPGGNVGG